MSENFIMALDQGTTSSRAVLIDRKGRVVQNAQKEFTQHFPQPGWVEHDPREILSTQLGVMTELLVKAQVRPSQIAGIGITNQRETTVVWDKKTGEPIYNAVVWQCRRTADAVAPLLEDRVMKEMIQTKTGLVPDAYFSASKIAWILDHVEGARERARCGELLFGTVDSWLVWNLTGGKRHLTDRTNASRTMLFNIRSLKWDDELLAVYDIPRCMLPEAVPSCFGFGLTEEGAVPGGIPICGVAGDQQASLFGQCCFDEGDVKNTYGTGGFLLMNTAGKAVASGHGLLTTVAASQGEDAVYALEGSVFASGAVIQWLRDGLGIIGSAAESEQCARKAQDSAGVYMVPAFTGLGAPYWDPYATGAIFGLTRGTSRDQLVRAALESLAFQSADVIRAMEEDSGIRLGSLKVDGGASANDELLQFQSDILGARLCRPRTTETTALGAAYLAGLQAGYWSGLEELAANWELDCCFTPSMPDEVRQAKMAGWHDAVSRTLRSATRLRASEPV